MKSPERSPPTSRAAARRPSAQAHKLQGAGQLGVLKSPAMNEPTVLVVDDDRANLESISRIFQHESCQTLSAATGKEALELLRKPEVRVLVTDLMMPGM